MDEEVHFFLPVFIEILSVNIESITKKQENKMPTTELGSSPVGRLSSCVGTLSGKLGQCAADTIIGAILARAHVLHTCQDVGFRVNQSGAGAPGL